MFHVNWRSSILVSVLAALAIFAMTGLSQSEAEAQESDLIERFRAGVEALNAGDGEAAASEYAQDAIFTDVNGGSFAAVGHPAIRYLFTSAASDPEFSVTVVSISEDGNTVSGVLELTDQGSAAAGVDRYVQPFVAIVNDDGKISSLSLTYDTSDPQTQTYLEFTPEEEEGNGEDPVEFIEMTLDGSQPGGGFVTNVEEFGGPRITFIDVGIEPAVGGSGLQPANVYAGTCESLGDIVSPMAGVTTGGNTPGRSTTYISIPYSDVVDGNHAIAISASDVDSTIVACSDLEGEAAGPPGLPDTGSGFGDADSDVLMLAGLLAAFGAVAVGLSWTMARARRRN